MPSAELQCNRLTCVTELVRESVIVHGAGDHHAADAKGGYRPGRGCSIALAATQIALKEADHSAEHVLECLLGVSVTPRYVPGQRDHRTGLLDVLEVLP
jgi:hypothetical protein